MLSLLHLCDSLFPTGGFGYSDGLESATAAGSVADADGLRAWMDVGLDETFGRLDGPAVWQAWAAVLEERWDLVERLDAELHALRPASAARLSSRAMGLRLLTTWQTLHPDARLARVAALARRGRSGVSLSVAFAAACACSGTDRRTSLEAFAFTRLAATVSAAMRLMPIGQTEAHGVLARSLERVPSVADRIVARDGRLESFTPALDIALMSQQYLHSRLFRS
ncbi:MAG TPA: urease accessory UreF family protein [Vicinamibacterales bacterium]|jgi:urease accessory protein